jgi:NAD(P)H-flavin reductase
VPARVTGLVALMALGLLLLPASKSSPILVAAGVSWESALWVHICLGMLFLVACTCHVALYFIQFVKLGHGLDVLPFNALFWYPQNPVGGNTPSDNWTVPMMATVFWPSIAIFGLFPWMRRKHYELFRYSHNFFMVLIPAAFWHATHAWYFLLPGVTLWMLDRFLRYLNATECVTLYDYAAHSVDCWTDPRSDRPSQNMPEKITKLAFTWPGQTRVHSSGMYVLVNLPQVSLSEWHPFSLSSSPLDTVASLHIKHMGEDSFTGRLHSIMSQNPKQSDIVMNIQGPYGPRIDLHSVPQVLLVAGGIGVTPMVNTLRCAAQRARTGKVGVLKRLHLVWSARSTDVFSVFHDKLALDLKELSIDVQISLYCSTLQEARPSSLGVINSGMPRFPEILAAEAGLGHCLVRVCGPPPMVDACTEAAKAFKEKLDFEPWSFVL